MAESGRHCGYHVGDDWRHDAADATERRAEADGGTSWTGGEQLGGVREDDVKVARGEELADEGARHLVHRRLCLIKSSMVISLFVSYFIR